MSDEDFCFNDLENKLVHLLEIHQEIKKQKYYLEVEIASLKEKLKDARLKNIALDDEVNRLKIVSAMSGNEEYKRLMKLKMNRLIKEVDLCIAQIKNK